MGQRTGQQRDSSTTAPAPKTTLPAAPDYEEEWQRIFFQQPVLALASLTAAAIRVAPALRTIEAEKAIYKEDVILARQNLLSSVSVGGSYNYGNLASIQLVDPKSPNQFNTFNSSRYSVGANVAVPLDRVVGRKHLINKELLQVERAESVRQEREAALRQQVLQLYQQVLLAKKVLGVHQESLVMAQVSQQLAEQSFRQGQVSMADLAAANERYTQATIARETSASHYTTAFLTLEDVVGAKISTLMTTSK